MNSVEKERVAPVRSRVLEGAAWVLPSVIPWTPAASVVGSLPAWSLVLLPVFALAQRRGWRGAVLAGGVALGLLGGMQVALTLAGRVAPEPAGLVAVALLIAGAAAGGGWMGERSRRERRPAWFTGPSAVTLLAPDGGILDASAGIEPVLGQPPAALRGGVLDRLLHPEDLPVLAGLLENPETGPAELRVQVAGGGWRTCEVLAAPVADAGHGSPAVALDWRDITLRLRREENNLLLHRMDTVGRLAAGTAHEFNNVLTSLQGHVQLLLEETALDGPHRHDLEGIRKAANRAMMLTRQLAAFSRQQVLQPEALELGIVVAQLIPALEARSGGRVELEVSVGGTDLWVDVDPGQLREMLLNLAANACDAMPDGGELSIGVRAAEIDQSFADRYPYPVVTGSYVLLTVADRGGEMGADARSRIFEPFFTSRELGRGTGLGLSAVYGTVKQSGGYIWVHSRADGGNIFEIYLPRIVAPAPGEEQERRPLPALWPERQNSTVLVVEDDEMVRSIVRRVLLKDGYSILEANDGQDALGLADGYAYPIDLLLTDIVMPEMGGRDLARCLSERRPEMRILFMSGHMDEAILSRSAFDGQTSFLQKPFTVETLAQKVQEVLRG